ncbi:MAG: uridine kinase [Proteobacteria bacterium]|nr:MAG: uridine kinase [Pseudomonadota bacterium]
MQGLFMLAPFMVAVSGGSGSGKTTFVSKLQARLEKERPLVVNIDHYYKDLGHLSHEERAACNFDDPESIEKSLLYKQISLLHSGQSVDRPSYDFASHTRTESTVALEPSPVIIMDGIFSLCYPELLQLFDLKIFIDVEDDIRVVRRIRRDTAERGRSFESCASQYLGSVKAMHRKHIEPTKISADIVIPWHTMNERAVNYIADLIQLSVQRRSL